MDSKILWWLYGLIVGDMLWVPYEFYSRTEIKNFDAIDLRSGGWWNVSLGTWSDDSSLMLCLVDALCDDYNLVNISQKMIDWKLSKIWVATGKRFDIGNQTSVSIDTLQKIIESGDYDCLRFMRYEADEWSNGNGAIMKILPLFWYIKNFSLLYQFEVIWEVSALTHQHILNAISCFIYLRIAHYLEWWEDKFHAYESAIDDFLLLQEKNTEVRDADISSLKNIISRKVFLKKFEDLEGCGFVVNTLEVALWSFLNTENFRDAIVSCISFGDDTDTTAAVCGGLAGLYYWFNGIPKEWRDAVLKKDEIFAILEKFSHKMVWVK